MRRYSTAHGRRFWQYPARSGLVLALLAALGCEHPHTAPVAPPATAPSAARSVVEGLVATYQAGVFKPVVGARLLGAGGASAVSGPDGRYVLDGLGTGPQKVRIEHPDYAPAERELIVMPGVGTPRANVLLGERGYVLRKVTAFDTVVSGAVFDPRGAALANAEVALDCPQAHGGAGARLLTRTNADGFFAATLANVTPGATPAAVTYSASGTSPGGVPLSTEADGTAAINGPRLVLNIQALKFPDLLPEAIVGSAFVVPGAEAKVSDDNMSTRADEFYFQLVSGDQRVDALPTAVETGQATFRIPFGLPDTAVQAVIVPFGRPARASTLSPPFITSYTTDDLERDLTIVPDATPADLTPLPKNVNDTRFLGGDKVQFTLNLTNANKLVPQDLALSGNLPVGTWIESVSAGDGSATVDGPDVQGHWTISGFKMPLDGSLPLKITVGTSRKLPNATPIVLSGMTLRMPSLDLTKPVPPPDSPVMPAGSVDKAAFTVTKTIEDDGTPGNGVGRVVLTLTPTNSLAGASFRVTDDTQTEMAGPATAARFEGTVVLPPPGVPMGLVTGDHLDLIIDAGPARITIFGPNYDSATLLGQINTTVGVGSYVSAQRTADGRISLERGEQGAKKTLGISATSSANLLAVLGLTPGFKASGYQATGFVATQPGGTTWTALPLSNTWSGNQNKVVFKLTPPPAYKPGDGPDVPITVTYTMTKLNGNPALVGGGGNSFGTTINAFNIFGTLGVLADDELFGKYTPDAALVSGL